MSILPSIPSYVNTFNTYDTDLSADDFMDFIQKILEACRYPYEKKGNVFKVRIVQIDDMMDGEINIFRTEIEKKYAVEVRSFWGSRIMSIGLMRLINQALNTFTLPVYPIELKTTFGTLTPEMILKIKSEFPLLAKEEADESVKSLLLGLKSEHSKYYLDNVQTLCRLMKSKYSQQLITGRHDVVEALVKLLDPKEKVRLEARIYAAKALSMVLTADTTPIEPFKATILEWIPELCSELTTRYNFYLKEFLEELRQILTATTA